MSDDLEALKAKKMQELQKMAALQQEFGGKVKELTASDFNEALRKVGDTPLFVDFWAEWCAPCRAVAPIIEKLAKEYNGKMFFAKLNVDFAPRIAQMFSIRSIPTYIIFYRGRPLVQAIGAMPEKKFRQFIESTLKKLEVL